MAEPATMTSSPSHESSAKARIIIIGATTGIGRALAELFLTKGYAVAISGRTEAALQSFAQISAANKVVTRRFDVTQPGKTEHLDAMIAELGGMDIFVYCAGGGDTNKNLDEAFELEMFNTNAGGFIDLTCHAFNYFVGQGSGQIVGISSLAALRGLQAAPAYSASKAFISNYLEALWIRARKAKLNIAVTDILPGFVATKGSQENLFWVVPLQKAARQIGDAIEARRKKAYISRRWTLVAWVMRNAPNWLMVKAT
jgi:short-subunit dehydrogenase